MTRKRWIFYGVFGLFHLTAFIFTIVIDNNSRLLFKMVGWVPAFKWMTLLGLVLLVVDIFWSKAVNQDADREKEALNNELTILKAKLFDLQENARSSQVPPSVK